MKKWIPLFSLLLIGSLDAVSQKRNIENPSVDFKKTGIHRVLRIEANDESTRVHMLNEFVPGWWMNFPDSTFLQDEATGKRYYITGIEGGEIDKKITTPASGDTLVVLIFAPLEKNVKKVHFGELDDLSIYGLSLEKPRGRRPADAGTIPAEVQAWMAEELGEYKETTIKPFDAPDFFGHGTARVVGYIKGYDPRAGFATGIIYMNNNITRESIPVAFVIDPDGRFTVDIPLVHPQKVNLTIDRVHIPVYLEQGSVQGVIIDWDDFLQADRYRDRQYEFQNTEYRGSLARLNQELWSFERENLNYREKQKVEKDKTPEEVKTYYRELFDRNMAALNESKGELSDDAYRLLQYAEYYDFGETLMDYEMGMRREEPLPLQFYDFLKDLPLNDPGFQTTGSWVFINRFEFAGPLRMPMPHAARPQLRVYLEKEAGVVFSDEDLLYFARLDSINSNNALGNDEQFMQRLETTSQTFYEKYEAKILKYNEKYSIPGSQFEYEQRDMAHRDSIYRQVLGLEPSLLFDITKTRKARQLLEYLEGPDKLKAIRMISDDVNHPFLKEEVWRLFEESLPKGGEASAFTLPPGKATDIFKGIVDRFKGNLVVVDFWATSCGPCIGNIKATKEQRKKLEQEGKAVYVFITDEGGSPQTAYDAFVKEQELTNTFRVARDEWNLLMQLFKFSGIPHYELLDKEGRVLDEKVSSHGLEQILKKYQ